MCKNIFIEIYLYRNDKEIHIADCHMITTSTTSTTSFSYSFYNPFIFSKHLGLLGSLWGRLTQNFIPDISGSLSIRSSDLPALGCCKFALLIRRQGSTKWCLRGSFTIKEYAFSPPLCNVI